MLHVLLKAITIYHECLFVTWDIFSQLGSLSLPEEFLSWPVRTSLPLVVTLSLPPPFLHRRLYRSCTGNRNRAFPAAVLLRGCSHWLWGGQRGTSGPDLPLPGASLMLGKFLKLYAECFKKDNVVYKTSTLKYKCYFLFFFFPLKFFQNLMLSGTTG